MNPSRRDFFKKVLVTTAAGVVAPSLIKSVAQAEERRRPKAGAAAGGGVPLVEPGKGMAASVNYVHNGSDIKDAKLKVDRQGVKFADQHCANCMLYTADGKDVGKCTLFAGQHVKATGWCTSWAKKA